MSGDRTSVTSSPDAAEAHLAAVLERLAGEGAVARGDQLDAVRAVLEPASRVLVVQATGWGKSAVYWAATSALRAGGAGPTLIVSPLLALMRDQVAAATIAGLRAATVNSTNLDEWDSVFASIDADEIDVLLVSPERLGNQRFAARLGALLDAVGLIVIDEAHCISDWGFDFRPDYQRLARVLASTPHAAVLATTATANERVTADVATQLGEHTVTFRGTLARTSLTLSVVPALSPLERYAWVADALATLPGSGIVYVLTVAEAERLAGFLVDAGYDVAAYTGALDADRRIEIEDRLRRDEVKAVVATSALGMGYDKPDLAFCVHLGSPSTPVAYYQQVGRAGRSLDHAEAVLLPAEADERIWEYFATASIPDPTHVAAVLAVLADSPRSVIDLETATGIRRGRLDALLKLLAVAGAVERSGSAWSATGVPYVHDAEKWSALRRVREVEADTMRRYARGDGCLMEFLQHSLDDPAPQPCGRCSVCTGMLPEPGARPSADRIEHARRYVRGADVVIEPRKRWPAGVARRGAIVGAAEGRAVAFGDDPGWSTELSGWASSGSGQVPSALLDGVVETLRRWRPVWRERPVAVVPLPGPEHRSSREVAEHVAAIGRLPVVDVLDWTGGAAPGDSASAAVVGHLESVLRVSDPDAVPSGPVLLVGATMRTGWAHTVGAALLREAGCSEVLPLAVHRLP